MHFDSVVFNIGDRVRAVEDHPDGNQDIVVGSTGTVVAISNTRFFSGKCIGVRWDDLIESGHDLDGACERGYGWWVRQQEIEAFDDKLEAPEHTDQDFLALFCGS